MHGIAVKDQDKWSLGGWVLPISGGPDLCRCWPARTISMGLDTSHRSIHPGTLTSRSNAIIPPTTCLRAGADMGQVGQRRAARAVALVAQAIEYFRGSRLTDKAPLLDLAMRLCTSLPRALRRAIPPAVPAGHTWSGSSGEEPSSLGCELQGIAEGCDPMNAEPASASLTLTGQTLRVMAALVSALGKAGDLGSLASHVPSWGYALAAAPLGEVLPFLAQLLATPG